MMRFFYEKMTSSNQHLNSSLSPCQSHTRSHVDGSASPVESMAPAGKRVVLQCVRLTTRNAGRGQLKRTRLPPPRVCLFISCPLQTDTHRGPCYQPFQYAFQIWTYTPNRKSLPHRQVRKQLITSLTSDTTASQPSSDSSPNPKPEARGSTRSKTQLEQDEELREKMEGISGEGGAAGVEYEDGKPVAMKRSVRENMFRYI